jgi:hypothetical protein
MPETFKDPLRSTTIGSERAGGGDANVVRPKVRGSGRPAMNLIRPGRQLSPAFTPQNPSRKDAKNKEAYAKFGDLGGVEPCPFN